MSNLKATLDGDWAYLRKQEWSMGNGQCPECHAKGPSWLGIGGWGQEIGHKPDCPMAAILKRLGQHVVFHQEYARKETFGAVDWDHPTTQALLADIYKAHPEMVRDADNGDESRG